MSHAWTTVEKASNAWAFRKRDLFGSGERDSCGESGEGANMGTWAWQDECVVTRTCYV